MTTRVGLWLVGGEPGLLERARRFVEALEKRLSRFRPDSELSRLNAAAGRGPQRVSAMLLSVIRAGLELFRTSGGLVDPALGSGRVRVDSARSTVELPEGAALDLGGIAKGWAADRLAERLSRHGPALVDMGGDLRACGALAWPVGLEDPYRPPDLLLGFELFQGGVATSGLLKRGRHLLDPRTGRPADGDLVAATVWAPTALAAEGAAKTALLLGSREAPSFLERQGLRGILFRGPA